MEAIVLRVPEEVVVWMAVVVSHARASGVAVSTRRRSSKPWCAAAMVRRWRGSRGKRLNKPCPRGQKAPPSWMTRYIAEAIVRPHLEVTTGQQPGAPGHGALGGAALLPSVEGPADRVNRQTVPATTGREHERPARNLDTSPRLAPCPTSAPPAATHRDPRASGGSPKGEHGAPVS